MIGIDSRRHGRFNGAMRNLQALLEPAHILRGTDRGLSMPMHAPSQLPELEVDPSPATAVARRNWLQRLARRMTATRNRQR